MASGDKSDICDTEEVGGRLARLGADLQARCGGGGAVTEDEEEMEPVKMAGVYKPKIRSELGSYPASAAIDRPAEVGRGAQQRMHVIVQVGDLCQQLPSAGKLEHVRRK